LPNRRVAADGRLVEAGTRAAGPRRSLRDGAGRSGFARDIKDRTDGAHGSASTNHTAWEIGDKEATDTAFKKAEVTIKELISHQRVHPVRSRPASASPLR
jgi:hypothetical protein